MAKNVIPQDKITQKWFLTKRPYQSFDDYDQYLINLTQDIYYVLKENPFPIEDFKLSSNHNKELAYILVGYFEDFMSEIGIWDALRKHHYQLYQTPVPIMVGLEDPYDDSYINSADLQFLIWGFYVRNFTGYALAPQFEYFYLLSENIFNMLDEEVEKGMATGFFEDYFNIQPEEDFYEVKEKLNWFVMESYILGFEYRFRLGQQFLKEQQKNQDPSYLNVVHRAIIEELLFRTPSQWSAMMPLDWIASFSKSEQIIKENLKKLKKQHTGKYKLLSKEDKSFRFQHLYNQQEYAVLKSSLLAFSDASIFEVDHIYQAHFAQWQDDWYLNGFIYDIKEKETDESIKKYQDKGDESLFLFDDKYRSETKSRNQQLEDAFKETFGDVLTFFDDGQKMHQGVVEFLKNYNEKYAKKDFKEEEEIPDKYKQLQDIALYFNKNIGYEIAERAQEFIDTAQKEEITEEEAQFLVKYIIFSNLSPQFLLELNQRYDLKKVPEAMKSLFDLKRELPFFLRFYKPYFFAKFDDGED